MIYFPTCFYLIYHHICFLRDLPSYHTVHHYIFAFPQNFLPSESESQLCLVAGVDLSSQWDHQSVFKMLTATSTRGSSGTVVPAALRLFRHGASQFATSPGHRASHVCDIDRYRSSRSCDINRVIERHTYATLYQIIESHRHATLYRFTELHTHMRSHRVSQTCDVTGRRASHTCDVPSKHHT